MKLDIQEYRLTVEAESPEDKALFGELAHLQASDVVPALMEMLMFFKDRSRAIARGLPAGTVRIWAGGDGVIVALDDGYAVLTWNEQERGWSEASALPPGAMAVLRSLPVDARFAAEIN